jgi:mannose-6-phosphate isomerase-like protein (cupin superfamily)
VIPPVHDLPGLLGTFWDHWAPRTFGRLNGSELRLVKFQGEFVWHRHACDELFLVLSGRMTLRFREGERNLKVGQLCIIPAGTEHITVAAEECHALVMDAEGEPNTGDAGGERTAPILEIPGS